MSTSFNIREKNFGSAFMESKILRAAIHQFTASKPGHPTTISRTSTYHHSTISRIYCILCIYLCLNTIYVYHYILPCASNQLLYIGICTLFRAYPPKTHQKPNISYLTCINHYILCFKCTTYITTLYLVYILFLLLYIVPVYFPPFSPSPAPYIL